MNISKLNFPKNFRDLKNLDLNIIASAQFSENQLIAIRKFYVQDEIIIVDLRLEDVKLIQNDVNSEVDYINYYQNKDDIIMPAIEKFVVKKYNFSYVRFPIRDYCKPNDLQLKRIINFIKNLSPHQKIYVHCALGIGRTTNFLLIYDIIKNAKNLSFDEILDRHQRVSGIDFRVVNLESRWNEKIANAKLKLLQDLFEKEKLQS